MRTLTSLSVMISLTAVFARATAADYRTVLEYWPQTLLPSQYEDSSAAQLLTQTIGTLVRYEENAHSQGLQSFICIHSNRILHTDYKEAIQNGADAFLPKPMSRPQLLKLLCQAIKKDMAAKGANEQKRLPSFAFVEDSFLFRFIWRQNWPLGNLHVFEGPNAFREHCKTNPEFLASLDGVITDCYFSNEAGAENGYDFALSLKAVRSDLPIVLASNGEIKLEDISNSVFERIIEKDVPVSEETVRKLFLSAFLKT